MLATLVLADAGTDSTASAASMITTGFTDLDHYLVALVGVLLLHIFAPASADAATARPFLEKWFEDRSDRFYFRANIILTVFLGAAIAVIYFQPDSTYKALFAGVGWGAAISWLVSRAQDAEAQQAAGSAEAPSLDTMTGGAQPAASPPEPADLVRDAVTSAADTDDDDAEDTDVGDTDDDATDTGGDETDADDDDGRTHG